MDEDLLDRFVRRRDEAAFEAMMTRYGPMILGVCRNVLDDPHDAEDAFQATFLVLARKAASIRDRGVLGAWLYGVAYRVASRAKREAARRREHERRGADMVTNVPQDELAWRELRAALHEEVNRLPEKYRTPVVLCYLDGRTHEEAARDLDWPLGTVKGRLARARVMLQGRLARRDLAIPAAVCLGALSGGMAAAVPDGLAESTMAAGLKALRGEPAGPASRAAAWADAVTWPDPPGDRLAAASRRAVGALKAGVGRFVLHALGGARRED